MKYLFVLFAVLGTLLAQDPPTSRVSFDESIRPLNLTPKQELTREIENPISVEDILPTDNAEPRQTPRKTFAQLMAERSFKCHIL